MAQVEEVLALLSEVACGLIRGPDNDAETHVVAGPPFREGVDAPDDPAVAFVHGRAPGEACPALDGLAVLRVAGPEGVDVAVGVTEEVERERRLQELVVPAEVNVRPLREQRSGRQRGT